MLKEGDCWVMPALTDLCEASAAKENGNVEDLSHSLKALTENRLSISKARIMEFASAATELSTANLEELLFICGLADTEQFDCDELAKKLLDKLTHPPTVFELVELNDRRQKGGDIS